MQPRRTVIVGANGQLGRALQRLLPEAIALTREDLDVTDAAAVASHDWSGVGTVVNASAHTAVDAAETPEGRRDAWAVNAQGVANLAAACREHRMRLVQVSTDYVFDGSREVHDETEPFSPLGVYGQSKAAGDAIAATVPQHYVVRTSWVVGEGKNFVTTMAGLAERGISPAVVDDQFGRLTFADDLAAGIVHLLEVDAPVGTYNLTNSGPTQSWFDVAREVFAICGRNAEDVSATSTEAYGEGKQLAPRPRFSTLDLTRIEATGHHPADAATRLREYLGRSEQA